MSRAPWFAGGLRFACERCGTCCTGEPGYVYVSAGEVAAAASHLRLETADFLARHARRVPGGVSLREDATGRCVFHDAGCAIYPVRPAQCRTYPFWSRIVADREAWDGEAGSCPGIGSGPLHPPSEIIAAVRSRLKTRGDSR